MLSGARQGVQEQGKISSCSMSMAVPSCEIGVGNEATCSFSDTQYVVLGQFWGDHLLKT